MDVPKRRQAGGKPMYGYRPTRENQEYIDGLVIKGLERSASIDEMVSFVRELREALGVEFYELERMAKVEEVGAGALAAKLIRPHLKRR